jgi:hypothetical protein
LRPSIQSDVTIGPPQNKTKGDVKVDAPKTSQLLSSIDTLTAEVQSEPADLGRLPNALEVRRGRRDLIPMLHRHLHLVDARREPKKNIREP